LQVASQADQVVVSAERLQGEAEAINIERTSDDIVQVLPERVITSLPNTNIADAVGRVPSVSLERDEGEGKYVQIRGTEPRLSNVTVNSVNLPSPETNVRNIKLDAVPADLVERIEVFKTLSANQDADGIGGIVNLVTRTAGERPIYAFGGTGGYNPIQNGYWRGGFNGVFGKRFGVSKKFGFLLNGTYDKTDRGIDDQEPGQATGTDPATGRNVAFAGRAMASPRASTTTLSREPMCTPRGSLPTFTIMAKPGCTHQTLAPMSSLYLQTGSRSPFSIAPSQMRHLDARPAPTNTVITSAGPINRSTAS
jgi:TonB-dependent receptor